MIRFFISSTFDDMLAEREMLHKRIVPKINEYAKRFGESVEICDLRWGIDTSDTAEGEALYRITEICLKKIDECDGCIVAFWGDRYGTIPNDTNKIKQQWPKTRLPLDSYEISITQLELEYGILTSESCFALCYFRNAENSPTDTDDAISKTEKRIRLKERLELSNGTQCKEYKAKWNSIESTAYDLDELECMLLEDLKKIVTQKAGEQRVDNWIEGELLVSKSIFEKNALQQAGKRNFKKTILEEIRLGTASIISIYGNSGSGKSTLMANLYDVTKDNACFISCGHGTRSKIYIDILMQIIYAISGEVTNPATAPSAEKMLEIAIWEYENSDKESLIIFIDAIDKITLMPAYRKFEDILLSIKMKKIKFVFSGIDKDFEESDIVKVFEMKRLSEEDIRDIFVSQTEMCGSGIDCVVEKIIKKKDSDSPLYVANVINILKMNLSKIRGKSNSEIFDIFTRKVCSLPETVNELCREYFYIVGTEYLHIPNHELFLEYIAATENGISKKDLANLMPDWNELDFYYYFQYLDENFCVFPDGHIRFSHDIVADSVKSGLGERVKEIQDEKLYPYLKSNIALDSLHLLDGLYLSARKHDYEYMYSIFSEIEKVQNNENSNAQHKNAIITEAAINMYTAYKSIEDDGWFSGLLRKYPMETMRFLLLGIKYDMKDSYARIIPMTALSDEYFRCLLRFDTSLYENKKHIQSRIKSILSELNSKDEFDFCVFIAEYVSAYEAISVASKCFHFEYIPFDFFCRQTDYSMLNQSEKDMVFTMVNHIFYSNNKYLNEINRKENPIPCTQEERLQAKEISEEILNWYAQNIKGKGYDLKKEGMFLSNVGQYLHALQRYKECTRYRALALIAKIKAFGVFFSAERGILNDFCTIINDMTIMNSRIHRDFWENYEPVFDAYVSKADNSEELSKSWSSIAISYRTIATDCYYLSNYIETTNVSEKIACLNNGIEFFKLCLFMQNNNACDSMIKEKVVTQIRLFGITVKMYHLFTQITAEKAVGLCELAENTLVLFARYLKNDENERSNLKSNIVFATSLPLNGELKVGLENLIKQLEKHT